MSNEEKIKRIKTQTMQEIENAARIGDTMKIITKTKILEEIEQNEKKLSQVNEFIKNFSAKNNNLLPTNNFSKISSRQKAKELKNNFLSLCLAKGITLTQKKGSIYFTESKNLVGIAYAKFDKKNIKHWFLGLLLNDYKAIILMCEHTDGKIVTFIIPDEFYKKYKNKFSIDSNNQIKFNIFFDFGSYTMTIPGIPNQKLDNFIDNFDSLKHI